MDPDLDLDEDRVELRSDEPNELFFKITVEGTSRAPEAIRLVCEDGDLIYAFRGQPTSEAGVVRFVVPPLDERVEPGKRYATSVEVLVESKYFVPVRFVSEFKKPVRVVAEGVRRGALSAAVEDRPRPSLPVVTVPAEKEISVRAQPVKPGTLKAAYKLRRESNR